MAAMSWPSPLCLASTDGEQGWTRDNLGLRHATSFRFQLVPKTRDSVNLASMAGMSKTGPFLACLICDGY